MSNLGKRVLLVDDDVALVTLLSMKLTRAGYSVESTSKPETGYRLAREEDFDAIVLDVVMPRISGLEICAGLRAKGVLTPVLILSGQTERETVVQGLNAGADDYLTKPFDDGELSARIRALLRRNKKSYATHMLERCGVELDVLGRIARHEEQAVPLTAKEVLLLKRLMAESPKPVERLVLLQEVWGIDSTHASNRLDVYIRRVRQKLRIINGKAHIHTVRSGGYYFDK